MRAGSYMSSIILHALISTAISYPILSLFEYVLHRYLMHSPRLARALQSRYLLDTFYEHAVLHHRQCYDVFDKEDRPCGGINIVVKPITSLTGAMLPFVVMLPIDLLTSVILFAGAIANGALWSKVHSEMHRPTGSLIGRSFVFGYLRRVHFLHHRHPGANFNTLYPMWDWVFRTVALQTPTDLKEMEMGTWRVRGGG
jgi:hypothetical protein